VALLATPVPVARAATYDVDTTTDSAAAGFQACTAAPNDCSLRGAIIKVNGDGGGDTINLGAGLTYTLTIAGNDHGLTQTDATIGDLDITESVTINGNGSIVQTCTVQPGAGGCGGTGINGRVFHIELEDIVVNMNDMFVENGYIPAGGGTGGGNILIYLGTLNLNNTVVKNGRTEDTHGGGVLVTGVSDFKGTLNLTNGSQVRNNTASGGGWGGGIACPDWCNVSLASNSELHNNISTNGAGGGIYFSGRNGQTLTSSNSRIYSNQAFLFGGGIQMSSGAFTITNTHINNNATLQAGGTAGGMSIESAVLASSISQSRIAWNTSASTGSAIFNSSTNGITAQNNWWGCSNGPGTTGATTNGTCAGTSNATSEDSAGAVVNTSNPLTFSALGVSPFNVPGGGTTTLTALINTPANTPDGTPIAWGGVAALGTITGATTFTGGQAVATFTSNGTSGPGSPSATVDHETIVGSFFVQPQMTITKAFSPSTINVGGTSTLAFTLVNPFAETTLTLVNFTDALPIGVELASATAGGTCLSPTFTPALAVGGTQVNLTDLTMGPDSSCTIIVTVTGTADGTHVNTTGFIRANEAPSGISTASARLVVNDPTPPINGGGPPVLPPPIPPIVPPPVPPVIPPVGPPGDPPDPDPPDDPQPPPDPDPVPPPQGGEVIEEVEVEQPLELACGLVSYESRPDDWQAGYAGHSQPGDFIPMRSDNQEVFVCGTPPTGGELCIPVYDDILELVESDLEKIALVDCTADGTCNLFEAPIRLVDDRLLCITVTNDVDPECLEPGGCAFVPMQPGLPWGLICGVATGLLILLFVLLLLFIRRRRDAEEEEAQQPTV
jgi:hypothetical protein